jgi:methylglutaconyl-CoA hydratase
LVACCDIAIAAQEATFSFSETKLGLIPATISPYIIDAIGARQARRYFLTAERFSAAEAFRIGLVHDIVPLDELDARINEILGALLVAGPKAQTAAKALIGAVAHRPDRQRGSRGHSAAYRRRTRIDGRQGRHRRVSRQCARRRGYRTR